MSNNTFVVANTKDMDVDLDWQNIEPFSGETILLKGTKAQLRTYSKDSLGAQVWRNWNDWGFRLFPKDGEPTADERWVGFPSMEAAKEKAKVILRERGLVPSALGPVKE